MSATIYKILRAQEWEEAQKTKVFKGLPQDARDGFLHFSAGHQVRATAERYFRGQEGLVLVAADAGVLGEALKWEVSRGGEKFPHLFGELPLGAIVWMKPMPLLPDGRHLFPDEIP